jgi:hypothetical protein
MVWPCEARKMAIRSRPSRVQSHKNRTGCPTIIITRRFALFLFPGSYSENQFANYLPTFRAIRYLYSLALLHDAPLAKATSSKTRNGRWPCRPSRTKRVTTCRLSMPAEVSCEGNAREAGKTRPIASKPASQNTKLLKFDPSKIIGKPKGCLR